MILSRDDKSESARESASESDIQGTQGTQGAQGIQGTQGTQGTQGISSLSTKPLAAPPLPTELQVASPLPPELLTGLPLLELPKLTGPEQVDLDMHFMALALEQARLAMALAEVPIGAVVSIGTTLIASAHNRRETDADPAAHAEFIALYSAARRLGRWRLSDCTVYVTLEPCLMCAGLMLQARIDRCVFAASDPKAGALGTLYAVHADARLNHHFTVQAGVCESESADLLRSFFANLRQRNATARQKEQEGGEDIDGV